MYKKLLRMKLLVVLCLAIIACSNGEVNKGEYLKKGIALFEQEQYKASELEIKNAIQEDPKVAEAHYYMALVNEKASKFKAMRENLLEAVRLDPESEKTRLKLGKVYLLFNELDKSLEQVNMILAKNPTQLDTLSLKASIFLRQEKSDEALAIIEQVLQQDPGHIEAVSLKTIVLMKNKAFDEALAVLTPILVSNEKNISLHLLKIRLDSQMGDVDVLLADYEKLVELKPDEIRIKYALANIYFKAHKIKQGENLLRSLIKNDKGAIGPELALINYLYSVNNSDALNELDGFIKKNKGNVASLMMYSKWLLAKNEINKAKEILNSLTAQNNNVKSRDEARLILAKLEIPKKSFEKALEYIDKVGQDSPVYLDASLLKAQILSANKKYTDAVKIVEQILWQKPDMDQALSLLGSIHLAQGDLDKAYANYKDALTISPKNLRALNFIVNKEIREEHVDYAIELLESALRYLPSQMNFLTQLVELYSNKKQWDKAEKYIERISLNKKGKVLSEYLTAKVLYKKGDCEKAIVSYKELLEKSPWVKQALVDMAECYTTLKQPVKFDAYLDGFIKSYPKLMSGYLLKNQIMLRSKHYKKAIAFIRESLQHEGLNHTVLYSELGRLYSMVDDKNAEYKAYIDGLTIDPENTSLLLRLASYYEQGQAFDKAVEQYKKILSINSGHHVARNNLATLYLDHYDDSNLVKKALELTEVFKQSLNPYFLDSYGWAQLKSGDIDKAMAAFNKVVMVASDTPVFRYHLAIGYYKSGDKMTSASELKQALQLAKGKKFSERKIIEKLLVEIKNESDYP